MKDKDSILLENAYQTILENQFSPEKESLLELHIDVDGIPYYVGYVLDGRTPIIHEIYPHEGMSDSDEPIFDIKNSEIDKEEKLGEVAHKVYVHAKEKLDDEYALSDEDEYLDRQERNPFSREYMG